MNRRPGKPILIYDGQCGFCVYWVNYWQKLTGDNVIYQPYQEAASHYPEIPIENFKRAVQYISPDGSIKSAALASFLTMSQPSGKSIWLTLYRQCPGFAYISEKMYSLISSHRELFFKLSLFLWGPHPVPPEYTLLSWLFLRFFGLIFLAAFLSFGSQALGLIGSQGILPLTEFMNSAKSQVGSQIYELMPMVFWFNGSDTAILTVCLSGILFSLLLIFNILPRISLLFLYISYLSLTYAGQVFMTFQWDLFLIEGGILAIFLVKPRVIGIWLMRWLLFRFMLGGGLVKMLSGDPSWPDFTALHYYFETEPLPTPLAWYAHHLPSSLLSFATAATLVIELIIPFLFFCPRRLRFFGAYATLLLQILILVSGNYNFFNVETILLCLVLFDDAALLTIIPKRVSHFILKGRTTNSPQSAISCCFTVTFAIVTVFISLVQFPQRFGVHLPEKVTWLSDTLAPLRLVNGYGPFAVMTKERMEIIVEGSNDGTHWQEYKFKYKPDDITRRPPWNIPHQPRLDWQMWFAALGQVEQNPWFFHFMERLLENSPTVLALLKENPFPNEPPKFVRAQFYQYHFSSEAEKEKNIWWQRKPITLYFPETRLKNSWENRYYLFQ